MDLFADVLNRTNDWLKFAEAKNGLLVAGTTSFALAGLRLLLMPDLSFGVKVYLYQMIAFATVGGTIGLISFLPSLGYNTIIIGSAVAKHDNLLFYGHLAHVRPHKLAESLRSSVSPHMDEEPIHKEFAEQIIINSRIALVKYKFFTWGLQALIVAILTPVLGGLLLFFAKAKDSTISD